MTMIKQRCDFCQEPAVCDGKTRIGPWAFMCKEHLNKYGYPNNPDLYSMLKTEERELAIMKRCNVCGTDKPMTEYYTYTDHGGIERARNECKACNLAAKKKQSFKK